MKLFPYLAALLLLSASGVAYGALECKFYNGDTRQIMSPGVQPIITFHPRCKPPRCWLAVLRWN